jgi:hypothetical protein
MKWSFKKTKKKSFEKKNGWGDVGIEKDAFIFPTTCDTFLVPQFKKEV